MEAIKQRCNKLERVGFSHYTEIIDEYNRSQHEVIKLIVAENGVDMMSMKTIENELIKVRFYLVEWKNEQKFGFFFCHSCICHIYRLYGHFYLPKGVFKLMKIWVGSEREISEEKLDSAKNCSESKKKRIEIKFEWV